ncbi:beta-lactamase domain-containing protein [Candidatus Termititenax persephonae]|uniref:Beta-lactamase domain-containing protein n=1 Tax=Candidatus Termititenax persephonae TaxID=2218525 RepID=A0A388TJ23_9BACT|nr:beta-lactamase domain-containing protein [Candidatus Termititenax persephonae]
MRVTFLGTGTSNGVPMVACACAVCRSDNPHNKRLRSSVWLEKNQTSLLIDASSDFRQQALTHNILAVDSVLITHTHADHVFGLDEFRQFNIKYQKRINVYLSAEADQELRTTLRYMYETPRQKGGGVTALDNHILQNYQTINIGEFSVTALPIKHGLYEIFGYRVDNFAYLTDCSEIPEKTFEYLQDLDILVLDALRNTPHPTHFSLAQAVAAARRLGARQTYFTHIAHNLEHEATNQSLPENMQLAYDGLTLDLGG